MKTQDNYTTIGWWVMDALSMSHIDSEYQDSKLQVSDNNTSGQAPGSQEPNFSEAERFLTLLDETAEAFSFQTFDDSKERRTASLAKVLHGTLEEHWTERSPQRPWRGRFRHDQRDGRQRSQEGEHHPHPSVMAGG